MPHKPTGDWLQSIGFFGDLSKPGRAIAQRDMELLEFEPGQMIVAQSEAGQDVYFLLSGSARAALFSPAGRKVGFRVIETGDIFGELAAIDQLPRSASVEAEVHCSAARLTAAAFWHLLAIEPGFTANLLKHLVTMNRVLTERVYEFSAMPVRCRVQSELLRMVTHDGSKSGRAWIDPAPTHEVIASRISTHREAVSRELSRLTRLGLIKRQGSALVVMGLEQLQQMVRDAAEK